MKTRRWIALAFFPLWACRASVATTVWDHPASPARGRGPIARSTRGPGELAPQLRWPAGTRPAHAFHPGRPTTGGRSWHDVRNPRRGGTRARLILFVPTQLLPFSSESFGLGNFSPLTGESRTMNSPLALLLTSNHQDLHLSRGMSQTEWQARRRSPRTTSRIWKVTA